MKTKRLTILILATYVAYACLGQGMSDNKAFKSFVETRIISNYDTLYPPVNLNFYNHSKGLPKGNITDLAQTNDGYVWIAISQHGLVRYDGYYYRSFKPENDDSTSLPAKEIRRIVKSKRNGLWLVSESGLIWFDLKTYQSKIISNIPKQVYHITVGWNCIEDKLGRLWIYGKGLLIYDPSTERIEELDMQLAVDGITGNLTDISKYFFESNSLQSSLLNNGSFWIIARGGGSLSTLIHIIPEFKKITCYSNNTVWLSEILPDPSGDFIWASCSKTRISKKGKVKISTSRSIGRYNIKENKWLYISLNGINERENINHYALSYIENGKLWFTRANIVRILDTKTLRCQFFENDNIAVEALTIVKGRQQNRWLWNEKNKLYCNFSETNRFTYFKILPKGENVVSYWKDEKNNVEWYGTVDHNYKASLYKYDLRTHNTFQTKIPFPSSCYPTVLAGINNREILVGVSPRVHRSAKVTLFRFDTKTHSFQPVSKKISNHSTLTTDSLSYTGVTKGLQNNLWLTTFEGHLLEYERKSGKFYLINSNDSERIYHTISDRSNKYIWAGGKSLFRIDAQSRKVEKFQTFINSDFVIPLCEDANGNLLIKLKNVIILYNPTSKIISPVADIPVTVRAAIFDNKNNIISLAEDGLWFYDLKLKASRRFDENDGLEEWNTFNLSEEWELIVDDSYRFSTNFLYTIKPTASLHLTSIKILGKELTTTNNVDTLKILELNHDQNQLSFEFISLSFLPHDANSYACFLEGLDTAWQQQGSNNIVSYANLAPGNYKFKLKIANEQGVGSEEKILSIVIVPAFWQTVEFKILIVLVIIAFVYWLYQNQLTQIHLKNELEKEKLLQKQKETEFQKRLADLTLSALRSQINPHFIFNCLNSIKLYATQNDVDAASEYLTKFSKLLRKVLDNSRNEKIPLSDELEVLQLYIEMEAMRFKDKLKYSISTNHVETDYIEIPPLLLQPYVENAIWHGLMNKEDGGHIDITTNIQNTSTLIITIKDNGVGRAKAAELKSKIATQHKSFGMKITSERLALINQIYNTAANVIIEDLTDENGVAGGTQVIIQIEIL